MTAIKLIVGLGNPGPSYEKTRHNAGFWLLEEIASEYGVQFAAKNKFFGQVSKVTISGQTVHLIFPTTYMNRSGQAVSAIAKFYDIEPEQILVAHDELDIPVGDIRLKYSGGHAGHNGLRDIIKAINSKDFYRLRIGIDRPNKDGDVADYVLKAPSKTERQLIDDGLSNAMKLLPTIVSGDINAAMKSLHTS